MALSEGALRELLRAAPVAMMVVDSRGDIVFLNDRVEELFGWGRDELVGQPVDRLVPERVVERHPELRSDYLARPTSRQMGAELDVWARRKDGAEFPAEVRLGAVVDADADQWVLVTVRDVTLGLRRESERKAAALEAEQEQAHRLESLGHLAGGIAHDFNNLLGVILNYCELIGRVVTDPSVHDDLGEIRAAAERGAALTRQLLTVARLDSVEREPLDVNDIVRGMETVLEQTVGDDIVLHMELADSPVIAEVDRMQLEQIIIGLALNARDAMPDGGELLVALDRVPTQADPTAADVTIRVTDSGTGMSPEVVSRAFEPFFTTKDRVRSSGLGLSTAYGIARRSGGDIVIDSVLGSGTTVTVRLPCSARAPAVHEQDAPVVGGQELVLLAEDEEPLRVATARLLENYGYRVVVARDGLEALELLEARGDEVDILITDVVMPRMRGDELALRVAERWEHLPVLVVSGHNSGVVAETGRTRLDKPVGKDTLLRALREALDD